MFISYHPNQLQLRWVFSPWISLPFQMQWEKTASHWNHVPGNWWTLLRFRWTGPWDVHFDLPVKVGSDDPWDPFQPGILWHKPPLSLLTMEPQSRRARCCRHRSGAWASGTAPCAASTTAIPAPAEQMHGGGTYGLGNASSKCVEGKTLNMQAA